MSLDHFKGAYKLLCEGTSMVVIFAVMYNGSQAIFSLNENAMVLTS
jgi:hypothetical protein